MPRFLLLKPYSRFDNFTGRCYFILCIIAVSVDIIAYFSEFVKGCRNETSEISSAFVIYSLRRNRLIVFKHPFDCGLGQRIKQLLTAVP